MVFKVRRGPLWLLLQFIWNVFAALQSLKEKNSQINWGMWSVIQYLAVLWQQSSTLPSVFSHCPVKDGTVLRYTSKWRRDLVLSKPIKHEQVKHPTNGLVPGARHCNPTSDPEPELFRCCVFLDRRMHWAVRRRIFTPALSLLYHTCAPRRAYVIGRGSAAALRFVLAHVPCVLSEPAGHVKVKRLLIQIRRRNPACRCKSVCVQNSNPKRMFVYVTEYLQVWNYETNTYCTLILIHVLMRLFMKCAWSFGENRL